MRDELGDRRHTRLCGAAAICAAVIAGGAAGAPGNSAFAAAGAQAAVFKASLVRTIDTAAFSQPSPDPSGLTYLEATDRIVMVDGEVEETVGGITHFEGANVWEMTRSGAVTRTANISKIAPTQVPMTDEPTGVAFDPGTGRYYVTDDSAKRVYSLNPGADGLIGTSDDSWTHFSTTGSGNGDPEGIAFDTWRGELVVADGVGAEIYRYTPAGSLVGQVDVLSKGVADPESVEFNPANGSFFVLSNRLSGPIIVEVSTSGELLQTIDVAAAGAHKPAGLTYAPASDGSGAQRFYISDRGVDNNTDPRIVDGKIYELTAPATTPESKVTNEKLCGKFKGVPDSRVCLRAKLKGDELKKVKSFRFKRLPTSCSDGVDRTIAGKDGRIRGKGKRFQSRKGKVVGPASGEKLLVKGKVFGGGKKARGSVRIDYRADDGATCSARNARWKLT